MFEFSSAASQPDNGLGASDQAAGLRRWAEQQGLASPAEMPPPAAPEVVVEASVEPSPSHAAQPRQTLMVVGLPDASAQQSARAWQTLQRWHANGHRWLGDPQLWRIVALDVDSPHFGVLAAQQSRWALWVDSDLDSFRRAYLTLRRLAEADGPQRLLVLHPGIASHRGLLGNLQQAAAGFLGIELLLLAEQPGAAE